MSALSLVNASLVAQQQQDASEAVTAPTLKEYRLQSGDTISVFYRLTPEYNQSLTILPDGTVNLRLIGRIQAAGRNAEQLQQVILAAANQRLRKPEVSVSVTDFVREQFTVMGEVGRAGRYEIHGPLNLVDAIAMASGFTQQSAQRKVILVRPLSPTSEYGHATLFDFKHLIRLNQTTAMPVIQNGDLIIVTTSKFAKVQAVIKLANLGVYYNPLPTL